MNENQRCDTSKSDDLDDVNVAGSLDGITSLEGINNNNSTKEAFRKPTIVNEHQKCNNKDSSIIAENLQHVTAKQVSKKVSIVNEDHRTKILEGLSTLESISNYAAKHPSNKSKIVNESQTHDTPGDEDKNMPMNSEDLAPIENDCSSKQQPRKLVKPSKTETFNVSDKDNINNSSIADNLKVQASLRIVDNSPKQTSLTKQVQKCGTPDKNIGMVCSSLDSSRETSAMEESESVCTKVMSYFQARKLEERNTLKNKTDASSNLSDKTLNERPSSAYPLNKIQAFQAYLNRHLRPTMTTYPDFEKDEAEALLLIRFEKLPQKEKDLYYSEKSHLIKTGCQTKSPGKVSSTPSQSTTTQSNVSSKSSPQHDKLLAETPPSKEFLKNKAFSKVSRGKRYTTKANTSLNGISTKTSTPGTLLLSPCEIYLNRFICPNLSRDKKAETKTIDIAKGETTKTLHSKAVSQSHCKSSLKDIVCPKAFRNKKAARKDHDMSTDLITKPSPSGTFTLCESSGEKLFSPSKNAVAKASDTAKAATYSKAKPLSSCESSVRQLASSNISPSKNAVAKASNTEKDTSTKSYFNTKPLSFCDSYLRHLSSLNALQSKDDDTEDSDVMETLNIKTLPSKPLSPPFCKSPLKQLSSPGVPQNKKPAMETSDMMTDLSAETSPKSMSLSPCKSHKRHLSSPKGPLNKKAAIDTREMTTGLAPKTSPSKVLSSPVSSPSLNHLSMANISKNKKSDTKASDIKGLSTEALPTKALSLPPSKSPLKHLSSENVSNIKKTTSESSDMVKGLPTVMSPSKTFLLHGKSSLKSCSSPNVSQNKKAAGKTNDTTDFSAETSPLKNPSPSESSSAVKHPSSQNKNTVTVCGDMTTDLSAKMSPSKNLSPCKSPMKHLSSPSISQNKKAIAVAGDLTTDLSAGTSSPKPLPLSLSELASKHLSSSKVSLSKEAVTEGNEITSDIPTKIGVSRAVPLLLGKTPLKHLSSKNDSQNKKSAKEITDMATNLPAKISPPKMSLSHNELALKHLSTSKISLNKGAVTETTEITTDLSAKISLSKAVPLPLGKSPLKQFSSSTPKNMKAATEPNDELKVLSPKMPSKTLNLSLSESPLKHLSSSNVYPSRKTATETSAMPPNLKTNPSPSKALPLSLSESSSEHLSFPIGSKAEKSRREVSGMPSKVFTKTSPSKTFSNSNLEDVKHFPVRKRKLRDDQEQGSLNLEGTNLKGKVTRLSMKQKINMDNPGQEDDQEYGNVNMKETDLHKTVTQLPTKNNTLKDNQEHESSNKEEVSLQENTKELPKRKNQVEDTMERGNSIVEEANLQEKMPTEAAPLEESANKRGKPILPFELDSVKTSDEVTNEATPLIEVANKKPKQLSLFPLDLGKISDEELSTVESCTDSSEKDPPKPKRSFLKKINMRKKLLLNLETVKTSDTEEEKTDSGESEHSGNSQHGGLCQLCEVRGAVVTCRGPCQQSFHLGCMGLTAKDTVIKCDSCTTGRHSCFACKNMNGLIKKCSIPTCGKFYHEACLKNSPLSIVNESRSICALHVCLSCYNDDPRKAKTLKGRMVRCVRCPTAYHNAESCIAAGSLQLSSTNILCAHHFQPRKGNIYHSHLNTPWCMVCSEGGQLICCESCPGSFHAECLEIQPPEGNYFCSECKLRNHPRYGDIVWVKLGCYRWWPAKIVHPSKTPQNIQRITHGVGEFPVCFYGSHDYFWVHKGRVFLFQEGDKGGGSSSRYVMKVFKKAMEEVTVAYQEWKSAKYAKEAIMNDNKPSSFKLIKVNKPVGKVPVLISDITQINSCDCTPDSDSPCGYNSQCLNRMLHFECHPNVCPAGINCQNQLFQKRIYPKALVKKVSDRGFGLFADEYISQGTFISEYVGELVDEEECKRRLKSMQEENNTNYYFLTIEKDRIIDAGPKGNLSRFMNHSCQPNCETQKWFVNGETRIGLFAICDIKSETELTFNYNLECRGDEKTVCRCGASNCSGFIGVRPKTANAIIQEKKAKESIGKKRKRKSDVRKHEDECFLCKEGGELLMCDRTTCPKSYHLSCLGLTTPPHGKWDCPWHHCDVCGRHAVAQCNTCSNSFCKAHASNSTIHQIANGLWQCEDERLEAEARLNSKASLET